MSSTRSPMRLSLLVVLGGGLGALVPACHGDPCGNGQTRVGDQCVAVAPEDGTCQSSACAICDPLCGDGEYCAGPNQCRSFATKWAVAFPGQTAFGLKVDGAGNYYVLGVLEAPRSFLRSFGPDGKVRWSTTFDDSKGGLVFKDFALDAQGAIYVTGWFRGDEVKIGSVTINSGIGYRTDRAHIFLTKVDPATGNVAWARPYYSSEDGDQIGQRIAVDANGDVYLVATIAAYITFKPIPISVPTPGPDVYGIVLAKIDPATGLSPSAALVGTVPRDVAPTALRLGNGNIFIAGTFNSSIDLGANVSVKSAGSNDVFVLARDLDGKNLWLRNYGTVGSESLTDLVVKDDVYFTGGSGRSIWAARLNKESGEPRWLRTTNVLTGNAAGIVVSDTKEVYVSGFVTGDFVQTNVVAASAKRSIYISRLWNDDGSTAFTKTYGGESGRGAQAMVRGPSGDLGVLNVTYRPTDFGTGLVGSQSNLWALVQVTP